MITVFMLLRVLSGNKGFVPRNISSQPFLHNLNKVWNLFKVLSGEIASFLAMTPLHPAAINH